MKSKSKVVVIGGGAVGVSTLYHLAKKGWSDVVLVERKELTSGSTWHAAGLLPLFNMSYSVGQLHKYAVKLYKTLEDFYEYFGPEREISISKELTKIFEDTQRGNIKDIIDNYKNKKLKGEFVIVVKGLK